MADQAKDKKMLSMRVIECPLIYGNIRSAEACEECDHHKETRMLRPAGQTSQEHPEGMPAAYQVLCRFPVGRMIKEFVIEEATAKELKIAAENALGNIPSKEI